MDGVADQCYDDIGFSSVSCVHMCAQTFSTLPSAKSSLSTPRTQTSLKDCFPGFEPQIPTQACFQALDPIVSTKRVLKTWTPKSPKNMFSRPRPQNLQKKRFQDLDLKISKQTCFKDKDSKSIKTHVVKT